MNSNAKTNADAGTDMLTSSDILVCSNDGRLLSKFMLTLYDDDVRTLGAAKRIACKDSSDGHGERLVVVVSEETSTILRQLQPAVAANEPDDAASAPPSDQSESLRVLGPLLNV